MKSLTFVTGNPAKAEQLDRHLDFPVTHKKLDVHEIQSLDVEEVALHKAKEAYAILQSLVLVEDTSLTFNTLGSLPGPLIKWFLHSLDNTGLCKLLDGYADRSAVAEVCFVLYGWEHEESVKIYKGKIEGAIATEPRGVRGLGWDPIFIPKGYRETWGEMGLETQKETSMRRVALQKLQNYVKVS